MKLCEQIIFPDQELYIFLKKEVETILVFFSMIKPCKFNIQYFS